MLLHLYKTPSNGQVVHDSETLCMVRATSLLRTTLLADFATLCDLGTEKAGWLDVGLKQAVEQGIILLPVHDHGGRELRTQRLRG